MDSILDFIFHIDSHMLEIVSNYHVWTYAIIFLIIFCETGLVVTPFLPGDSLLFVIGAISAMPGVPVDVNLLAVTALSAAILGDTANYSIGKFFGERLFRNPRSKIFNRKHLDKAHHFYEKYGSETIIIARFVPIIRTFAPFVAGMGEMKYVKFMTYNVVGATAWVALFCYLGYFCGDLPFVQENLKLLMIAIIVVSLLPPVIEIIRNKNRKKECVQKSI